MKLLYSSLENRLSYVKMTEFAPKANILFKLSRFHANAEKTEID